MNLINFGCICFKLHFKRRYSFSFRKYRLLIHLFFKAEKLRTRFAHVSDVSLSFMDISFSLKYLADGSQLPEMITKVKLIGQTIFSEY